MSFFTELRRRNVYRVVTAYIIVGWLVMQVVDVMAPALLLPEWITSLIAVLLLIGFPITVVLAWVYDVTPDGVVRTSAADVRADSRTSRRLDILIVAGLVTVATLVVWQQFDRHGTSDAGYHADSIAVLPFEDLSPGGDQQYFADGVAEEIMNELASAGSLRVSGRTSSFSFRDSNARLTDIGAKLGVAALLEGSVRKQGDRVRIAASLVRTADGIMLWTDSFDVRVDDIFAVQDEIAGRVFNQLTARVDDTTKQPQPARLAQFDAYDQYLRAKELVASRDPQALVEARRLLDVAVTLDPDFAPPWATLALTERLLTMAPGGMGRTPLETALPRAIEYAERALNLDPSLADAHAVRGLLFMDEKELLSGETAFRRAIEINPSHINARLWLSLCLTGKQQHRAAAEQLAQLFTIDPLFAPVSSNLVGAWLAVGEEDRARAVVDRLERLEAPEFHVSYARAMLDRRIGNVAATIDTLQALYDAQDTTAVGAGLVFARLHIGDAEAAQRYGLPFAPVRAALLNGRYDDATELATNLLERSGGYFVMQIEYINALAAAGRDEQLIAYYLGAFGNPSAFARELQWPFNFYTELQPFAAVATALSRSGTNGESLAPLMQQWRQTIDIGRAHGGKDANYDINDAYWYALQGDLDRAMTYFESAANTARGLLGVPLFDVHLHELLSAHPRYPELAAENLRRINEERAKLGLGAIAF